jgi:hypothetical protein
LPIIPKSRAPIIPSGPEYEDDQEDGVEGTAPPPGRDEDGTLVFEGRWKGIFKPNVTPQEMFDGGAFGGGFFTSVAASVLSLPQNLLTLVQRYLFSNSENSLASIRSDSFITIHTRSDSGRREVYQPFT